LQPKQQPDCPGLKLTDCSRKGDYWELYVTINAWERGAEVYRNLGCSGSVDLVISYQDHLLRCDVKAMTMRRKYYPPQIGSVAKGVHMIAVHPVTKDICWHPRTIPPGLESFWN
jgi:hypothetical protein